MIVITVYDINIKCKYTINYYLYFNLVNSYTLGTETKLRN